MTTNYIGPGDVVEYTAGSTISSGDAIVFGTNGPASLGIALTDIANGATGSVAISGVFELAKVSGAVIVQGESVDWDASASAVDDNQMTPASGDLSNFGVAVESKGAGTTTVKVRLIPGVAVKT